MKRVGVFLADGFEEIEGLTVVDILRRAGVQTDMVSVTGSKTVCGAHQIRVQADYLFEELDGKEMEMLVLPGGMPGTIHLKEHEGLQALLRNADQAGRYLAAICAAPSVLGEMGILKGRRACCYPSFEEKLKGAEVVYDAVCVDGHIITSRGMGTAAAFALKLAALLCGEKEAEEVGRSTLIL